MYCTFAKAVYLCNFHFFYFVWNSLIIFAAKILENNDETHSKMISRELEIMIFVNHPTIIRFYGYSFIDFQNQNNITILMEYVANGSLFDFLKKNRNEMIPDYTNTIRQIILTGIARAMKYLHDCNIIHRDLKPGNILLDEEYQPHISDFGLSKFFDYNESSNQSTHLGTLLYMAPEVMNGDEYGRKVDVFSFGIIMYEIVTNNLPYPDSILELNEFKFIKLILEKKLRPKFNESMKIKPSIQELIEKCWSDEPSERPTFAQIFNKLTAINNDDDNYLLDNVDIEKFQKYIEKITYINGPIDILHNTIDKIQKEKLILKEQKYELQLTEEKLHNLNDQLRDENEEIKMKLNELMSKNSNSITCISKSPLNEKLPSCD